MWLPYPLQLVTDDKFVKQKSNWMAEYLEYHISKHSWINKNISTDISSIGILTYSPFHNSLALFSVTVHCITVGNYETGCTPSNFSKDNYSSFPLFVFCNRFHIFVKIVRLSSMIPGISWKRYLSYLQMISYKRYLECTLVQ